MSISPSPTFLNRETPPHVLTLVIGAGLAAATMNVYLPSLPNMAEWFAADYRLMQLSVSLYLAMNALLQLFIGPVSDRYGRRPVMLTAIFIFCLATLGTLLAPSIEVFLVCRMAQAVIVAGLVLSRAIVRDMVASEQAASMIGYVTMGMALVPLIAPLIGGTLDTLWGWKANFWFLLLLGMGVFALFWFDQGETAPKSSESLIATFFDAPELFRSRRFWGYCLTVTFSSGAFFAYLGGAPFVGSQVFGLSPAALGAFFGAPAIGYVVGNGLAGKYSVRFGLNTMIVAGCLIVAIGMSTSLVLFHLGKGSVWVFFGFMTTVGLGNGLTIPNGTAGMLSVRPHLVGTASGLGGAMMIGGGAALAALAGALLTPETGAYPLLWMMCISSFLGLAAIAFVLHREKQLQAS